VVLEAIDRGDYDALEGEIGDLIFEGVFLAQICADENRFTIVDALKAIENKLVRRHPHVFGPTRPGKRRPRAQRAPITAEHVLGQWEAIKAAEQSERGERKKILGGVKRSLPALLRAYEIGTRVGAVGFDWARAADVVSKIREEVDEVETALASRRREQIEEEVGDLLFTIASLARKLGVEPESALRRANEKFVARFEALEETFEADGRSIHGATLDEMERRWQRLKRIRGQELQRSALTD